MALNAEKTAKSRKDQNTPIKTKKPKNSRQSWDYLLFFGDP